MNQLRLMIVTIIALLLGACAISPNHIDQAAREHIDAASAYAIGVVTRSSNDNIRMAIPIEVSDAGDCGSEGVAAKLS